MRQHDLHLDAAFNPPPPETTPQRFARGLVALLRWPLKWMGMACLVVAVIFAASHDGWDAAQAFVMGLACVGLRSGLERLAWLGPYTVYDFTTPSQ